MIWHFANAQGNQQASESNLYVCGGHTPGKRVQDTSNKPSHGQKDWAELEHTNSQVECPIGDMIRCVRGAVQGRSGCRGFLAGARMQMEQWCESGSWHWPLAWWLAIKLHQDMR